MPVNNESLNRKLYELLKVRGFNPVPKDSEGETSPVPDEAEVFKMTFSVDGKEYGDVWITIDSSQKLVVYYDDSVTDSDDESSGYTWTQFLSQLKNWAQRRQLSFDLKNKNHLVSDMAQRSHMKKKEQIAEGYYPMGKQASYSDAIPTMKIVLQHTRQVQEGEQRFRNVARIFLENQQGERILCPSNKPGIAQVYARHLAEGGLPHDERWNHIGSLVEEYNKMAGFVRATRNNQFNESAQRLVNEGVNHYNSLRESLSKMRGHRGYNAYFESYTPPLMETESDDSNLNELFVQETMDPRIESVIPILAKLNKKIAEMKEVNELAEWADSIAEDEGREALNPIGIPESEDIDEDLDPEQKKVGQLGPYDKVGKKGAVGKLVGANESVAEEEKNPHTSALGKALYRDLSKEKKASPVQQQRNKERWAKRQAEREQGVAEGLAPGQAAWKKEMTAKGAVSFKRDQHGGGAVDRIVAYDKDGKVVGGFNRKGVVEGSTNKDMTGQTCEKCKKGKYQERSQHDDMQGMVTCKCGHRVDRWKKYKEQGIEEGIGDTIKRSVKNFKRGMAGWGSPHADAPGEIVKRNKGYDDKTVQRLNLRGKIYKDVDGAPDPHSPQGLQNRVLDREMKKRGLGEEGVAEAGNKPLEKSYFGTGDTRTPRDIKSQMRGASDRFVQSTADKATGPIHSKVAKMQTKMAKSELRKRSDHDRIATGTNEGVSEGSDDTAAKRQSERDKQRTTPAKKARDQAQRKGLMRDKDGTYYPKEGVAEGSEKAHGWKIGKMYRGSNEPFEVVYVDATDEKTALAKAHHSLKPNHMQILTVLRKPQGVAEGLSKRDQKDVDAIKAAIAGLEDKLKQPNADKEKIQQTIANEKKRLALYGKDLAEGLNESHMANVDLIMQELGDGTRDIYDTMNSPTTPDEQYVAGLLQDMYQGISQDHDLHPDDDFEQIIDIMGDQIAQDYPSDEIDEGGLQEDEHIVAEGQEDLDAILRIIRK